MRMLRLKLCSRCHLQPASTPRTAYCKPCRAAYQRAWRARKRHGGPVRDFAPRPTAPAPRVRLRGTPTRAEMERYGLL